jgi:predicted TIM-barrel fold metal-dependent hydrolase
MIIDLNAYAGHWPFHPVDGDLKAVRASLRAYGVDRICLSPLGAAWCRNPHRFNAEVYRASEVFEDIWPVPVLDPTVATWREELARAVRQPKVRLVKLLPPYGPYPLSEADALLDALSNAGLGVILQTRLEDPRRQHPLAQVPDLPASEVADAAERHPGLTVIAGGPRAAEIRSLRDRFQKIPNLYADVSQADGMDTVRALVDAGLTGKLLFGSHAPLFIPYSAVSRVAIDLSDEAATAILGRNAERIVRWER